jgi:hypothetical protein
LATAVCKQQAPVMKRLPSTAKTHT